MGAAGIGGNLAGGAAAYPSPRDGGRRLCLRAMSGAGLDEAGIERMRTAYSRDVAVLPPERVAALVEAAGFEAPLRFHQAGMIHGWCARRP